MWFGIGIFAAGYFVRAIVAASQDREIADLRNQLNEKHAEAEEYYGRMVEAEQLKEDAA